MGQRRPDRTRASQLEEYRRTSVATLKGLSLLSGSSGQILEQRRLPEERRWLPEERRLLPEFPREFRRQRFRCQVHH